MTEAPGRRRYLETAVREDLERKLVFIAGPRQVGKTTLARMISADYPQPVYLNWDNRQHKRRILEGAWSQDSGIVVLDEVHKYRRWKSLVKGLWDTRAPGLRLMITGSSRLDLYRRGGDSLLGRHQHYRLHPFSLCEIQGASSPLRDLEERPILRFPESAGRGLEELMRFGGFPEPLLSASARTLRRWQQQRFERVFREDIRDTEPVRELSLIEVLGTILPERVGAPLSYASLALDVEASPKTVREWLELLCRNYYAFRVPPYSRRLHRALKKSSKYYLWDWAEAPDGGPRFENLIAGHLLKYCHYVHDAHGHAAELFYLRDLDKRETDFLVTWNRKPWLAIECRTSPGGSLTPLKYFAHRLGVDERYVVTRVPDVDHTDRATGVRTISADRFLMALV